MKTCFVLFILMAPLISSAQDKEMVERIYPIDPNRWVPVRSADLPDPFGDGEVPIIDGQFVMKYFMRYGVDFPEGSSVVYEPVVAQLRVVNTADNLDSLEEVLRKTAPLISSAQEEEMIERFYPVDPTRWMTVTPPVQGDPFGAGQSQSPDDQYLLNLFKRYGVDFPEGASVVYEPLISQLRVVNTADNLARFEEILRKTDVDVRQVYVDYWAVKFDAKALRTLERKLGRPLQDEEYLSLWQEGKGEGVFSQGVRTVHGVNAIIESSMNEDPEDMSDMVLNVTPTVGNRGEINLVLLPAHRQKGEKWKAVNQQEKSWALATSVVLLDGKSVVLGHSSTETGAHRIVFFLSAHTVGVFWKK